MEFNDILKNEKLLRCIKCESSDISFSMYEDGKFCFYTTCKTDCPDKFKFDCMKCLLCKSFEECLEIDKAKPGVAV